MSVPKSQRGFGKLEALTKARQLKRYTLRICTSEKNFPKRYRWCITNQIVQETVDICRLIVMANAVRLDGTDRDRERRYEYQCRAYELTEALIEDVDTAYSFFKLSSKRVEFWASEISELQRLIKAWQKSDRAKSICSPNVGNANNVRNANPSGERNNNNANNSNGVAPDFDL